MNEGLSIGDTTSTASVGAVVIGRRPATLIVWPCGCARTGLGMFSICSEHQDTIFMLIDAQGDGEVASILSQAEGARE